MMTVFTPQKLASKCYRPSQLRHIPTTASLSAQNQSAGVEGVCAIAMLSFFFFFFFFFSYFWLCCVLIVLQRLSLVAASGRLLLLQSTGARAYVLSRCGTLVYLPHGMWNFPRPGVEPLSRQADSQPLDYQGSPLCCSFSLHTRAHTSLYCHVSCYVVVQLISHVPLLDNPWTAAHQVPLSFTVS